MRATDEADVADTSEPSPNWQQAEAGLLAFEADTRNPDPLRLRVLVWANESQGGPVV